MDRGNVISINSGKPPEAVSPDRKRLVEHSRDVIGRRVMPAVASMLERVDDALFELADKATNTTEQNLYFDAMREARLKRDTIKAEFAVQMEKLFIDSLQGKVKSSDKNDAPYDLEELSLIGDEDLEESLAVTNAVGKINSDCREELFALDRRMGYLLSDPELDFHVNPLGPENICNAFRCACRPLESGIEVRLIIFKLFEKYVTGTLFEAYHDANNYLIEQGVLPEIKSSIRRSTSSSGQKAAHMDPSSEDDAGDSDLYTALQRLMGMQMHAGSISDGSVLTDGHRGPSMAGGNTAELARVVSDLTRLQQQNAIAAMGTGPTGSGLQADTRNIVQELRANGVLVAANPADEKTIDIVSMMFDYILDDDSIPVAIKAQIGRLQIPVLKAALLDQSLFSRKAHPVRRLLDTIAHAAEGWEVDALDELVKRIESVVQRILLEFEDDIELFGEVLSELETYLAEQEQEYAGRRERIARVLKGREQIETAKRQIKNMFADRIIANPNPVPDFVIEFLLRNWSEVLLKAYIHEGEDSPAWLRGIKVVDNLIWSLLPKGSKEERRELIGLLPRMLIEIKSGMKQINMNESARKAFLDQLAECHANAVKSTRNISEPQKQQVTAPADDEDSGIQSVSEYSTEQQPADLSQSPFLNPDLLQSDAMEQQDIESVASENSEQKTLQSENDIGDCIEAYFKESEEVMRMLSTSELEIEEIELYEEDTITDQIKDDSVDDAECHEYDEYVLQANSLSIGDWVELVGLESKPLKLQLQSITESTGILSFVDRRGRNVVRKSAFALAAELRAGEARILEGAPLFERAIRSVVTRLSHLTG